MLYMKVSFKFNKILNRGNKKNNEEKISLPFITCHTIGGIDPVGRTTNQNPPSKFCS